MNVEKEVTISELKGKFTKDFDTFGKMVPYPPIKDVFLEFTVGKCMARTETADGMEDFSLEGGKEPAWKNDIVMTYFDEHYITVKAYDEDTTDKEYMGTGKL